MINTALELVRFVGMVFKALLNVSSGIFESLMNIFS